MKLFVIKDKHTGEIIDNPYKIGLEQYNWYPWETETVAVSPNGTPYLLNGSGRWEYLSDRYEIVWKGETHE